MDRYRTPKGDTSDGILVTLQAVYLKTGQRPFPFDDLFYHETSRSKLIEIANLIDLGRCGQP